MSAAPEGPRKSSSRVWIYGVVLVIMAFVAQTFLGFYTIQPIGAVPEGQTWLVWRQGDEPFFESADGRSLRRTGGVSLLSRAVALGQAPTDRIIVRLPYWDFAYRQSTGGLVLDR